MATPSPRPQPFLGSHVLTHARRSRRRRSGAKRRELERASGAAAASAVPRCVARARPAETRIHGAAGVAQRHHGSAPTTYVASCGSEGVYRRWKARFIFSVIVRAQHTRRGRLDWLPSLTPRKRSCPFSLELVSQSVHRTCVRAVPTPPRVARLRRCARVWTRLSCPSSRGDRNSWRPHTVGAAGGWHARAVRA